jgi:PAS domain S-box-containing protein
MTPIINDLQRDNEELRQRLEEAEQAIQAIRAGEVDAVLVETERQQVYTLETADNPYRLLVTRVPYPAATLTDDGSIIWCNGRFADLLQRPPASLCGRPICDFAAPESITKLKALLHDGRTIEVHDTVNLLRDDGSPASACLGVSPLREGALGLCLMVTDLTERRHYEELQRTQAALHASEERLKDADRKKDEFLATLAHELRNPLAPLRNAAQILKVKCPPLPELQWAQGVIDRQVRLMARMLDDLLDVSSISRNTLELRTERIELASVLEAALETSRPVIEACGHELDVALPSEPIHLQADPVRLAQAFANLLNNAAKYTEKGGRIRLSVERKGNEVTVSVKDDGIGIMAEMLPRIFDIFSQAKRGLVRSQGGIGIGLSLVKGLVELHGGSVEAKSAGLDRGSEFVVHLPVAS